jgi:hypothetical protein
VWCRPDYQSVQSAITVGTLFSEEGSMECGLVTLAAGSISNVADG